MQKFLKLLISLFLTLLLFGANAMYEEGDKNWPAWRGPDMNGVAEKANPPVEWSEEKNIRWKIPLNGAGNSSPIVWGDFVYVCLTMGEAKQPEPEEAAQPGQRRRRRGVTPSEQEFAIMAINRKDGSVAWKKVLRKATPHEGTHPDGTWSANSPVTDGKHIFAYFGSNGLYCLDMKGNLVWEKDLGDMRTRNGFGEGSSPALYGDKLVINWDHEDESFIVCLNKNTGKEIWRKQRDEVTSWATPVVIEVNGKPQVIVKRATKGTEQ